MTNKESVKRYYQKNKAAIVAQKTLRMVSTHGRIPRETTIIKNAIDREALREGMLKFIQFRLIQRPLL